MRFYTKQHKFYCGIDLHARTMYLCIFNQDGEVVLHRNMRAAPEPFLQAIVPYREEIVVCVECIFTWDLARGPLHAGGDSLRLGPRPVHESHSWGQGQERYDRLPHDCCAAPRRHAPAGLCLSG